MPSRNNASASVRKSDQFNKTIKTKFDQDLSQLLIEDNEFDEFERDDDQQFFDAPENNA